MATEVKSKKISKDDDKRPDYVCRARQAPGSDFFVNIGVAWEIEVNGKTAYSVKLNVVPLAWDGSFLLLAPLEAKE